MKRFLTPRGIFFLLVVAFIAWMLVGCIAAFVLTYPDQEEIAEQDSVSGSAVEDIGLVSKDGTKLSAWLIPKSRVNAVIILTGIRGNRTHSIKRAELYLKKGYTVLLPDLRGTGQSEGNVISFGWNERYDLEACYDLLRKKGYKNISAHGSSLGAATIIYSLKDNLKYDHVVLESSYDNIDNAFKNRTKAALPRWVAWPVYLFTEWRIKADAAQLCPEEYIKNLDSPVLYLAGDSEKQIKPEETQKIFDNIPAADKTLHIFKGAQHEDFMHRYEAEYVKVLDQFLDTHAHEEAE
jgi:fermentation-respiration switch protein FrsA (DUF1100 family)